MPKTQQFLLRVPTAIGLRIVRAEISYPSDRPARLAKAAAFKP